MLFQFSQSTSRLLPLFCFQDSLPFLFLGPAVTTGRSWSPPLAAPSAPPCPHLIAGESPKAMLTWCSKRRLPQRSSWRLCLTRPAKAIELRPLTRRSKGVAWEGILTHSPKFMYQKRSKCWSSFFFRTIFTLKDWHHILNLIQAFQTEPSLCSYDHHNCLKEKS